MEKAISNSGMTDKQERPQGYSPAQWLDNLSEQMATCTSDINNIINGKPITLAVQLRAYDLLENIAECSPLKEQLDVLEQKLTEEEKEYSYNRFYKIAGEYKSAVNNNRTALENAFNATELQQAAASWLRPWVAQCNKLQERADKAMALYNAADYAHRCQMNGSLFEKWRSLRKVRRMAGFRLERKRTGNYVTKTYELMLEAQKELMAAQQQMHSHNVGYKCSQMLYVKILEALDID